jgi:hypothetical protein
MIEKVVVGTTENSLKSPFYERGCGISWKEFGLVVESVKRERPIPDFRGGTR